MKNTHLKIFTIVFCFFISQIGWSQDQDPEKVKIEKTVEEFAKFFKAYDWTDYVEDGRKREFACRGDGIPRLKRMRNPFRKAGNKEFANIAAGLEWFVYSIDKHVSGTNFDKIKEKEGSFFDTPTFKRDKMIEKLQTAKGADQFIDFYGTKLDQSVVEFTPDEKNKLTQIHREYNRYFDYNGLILEETYAIGDCNYRVWVTTRPIKIESNQVTWKIYTYVKLNCKCSDVSSTLKLKQMSVQLTSVMTSSWKNYDYRTIRFAAAEKAKMFIFKWLCCGTLDMNFEDGDGYDETMPGNNGGKEEEKDQKEKDKLKREKKCCNETPANNSVGIFPTISFGNNLDDSTLGIGVEYLHRGGTSLANNNWYFGVGGQISNSSGQGGELKENFYSGAVIVENRTPILPCLQWTQRVSGEYGEGTLEAFGNKDDFTHFLVGLSTGVNFDLSANFSVAIDARIFEVGSQTFKPTNGPEIKTDIKNLSIPPTKVRFGFRFKF